MLDERVADNAVPAEAQPSFATEETAGLSDPDRTAFDQDPAADGRDLAEGVETTRAFSQRLKEMSGRQVDAFVAGMGLYDPYRGNLPIRTRQQYDDWMAAVRGDGAPAPQDSELARLQGEVLQLRSAERDRALLADPEQGPTYAVLRDKVQAVLADAAQHGEGIGLDAAYAAVLLRELPALQKQAAAQARQQALQSVQANGQASPGALGGPAANDAPDFERMSSSEFAEYHRRALRGEWQ